MTIADLQPAADQDVTIYAPYYQGQKRTVLPLAIALYQRGNLEGSRPIEGGSQVPFIATWFVSKLPPELTRCRLQFDGSAELTYEIDMTNSDFIAYLIDVIRSHQASGVADFPKEFYQKLLRMEAS